MELNAEGAFFATVARPKSWLDKFARPDVKGKASQQAEVLFQRYSERYYEHNPHGVFARLSRAPSLSPREAEQSKVQKYILGDHGQCAATVLPGASAIASIIRVLPYVHCDSNYLLCFFGYLSNLSSLWEQMHHEPLQSADTGAATCSLILALHRNLASSSEQKTELPTLLLSELQGPYAFFLYSAEDKQALAARDPSGEQDLFFAINPDDSSVSFTNSLEQLPPGEKLGRWREVPPGHYVSGQKPMLHQFALTPEQLDMRERNESATLGFLSDDEEAEDARSPPKTGVSPANAALNLLVRLGSRKNTV